MDIVDAPTRSHMMAGIRSRDTKPEFLVRRALHAEGLRYRLHVSSLPGHPDLVFPRHKAVVFVNGCFWHAHNGCRYFKLPATRPVFWREKLATNVERDQRNYAALRGLGWRIAVVWECATRAGLSMDPLAAWIRDGKLGDIELASGAPREQRRFNSPG